MNDDTPKVSEEEAALHARVRLLRQEHADLDASIEALGHMPVPDQLMIARLKRKKLTLLHKHNVLSYAGHMWRRTVEEVGAEFPDVTTDYCHVDAATIYLVTDPGRFDVIVTDNLFGDMLSDVAAMLTGSLGMLPSASLGAPDPATGKRKALYEPVHGSAPDIAGKGIANPIAMIASFAMCLRYSFAMIDEAVRIEAAVAQVGGDPATVAAHLGREWPGHEPLV